MPDDTHICKICNEPFEKDSHFFHKHKIKLTDYYKKFYPKKDLYSGEEIIYKNHDQYFGSDFIYRGNLISYIKTLDFPKVGPYIRDLLAKRKAAKNLIYSPTQVELRSCIMPSVAAYMQYYPDYYALCEELGFINKFKYIRRIEMDPEILKEKPIIIDTREQLPLEFVGCKSIRGTLKFGDYALQDAPDCVYIERKSLPDFIATLTGQFERFEREVIRAKEAGAYLVVLVESPLKIATDYLRHRGTVNKNIKIPPEAVFYNVRLLMQKYDNLQFLFVNGRNVAALYVKRLFRIGAAAKTIDLQLALDLELL